MYTIGQETLLDTSIVSNVLPLLHFAIEVQTSQVILEGTILINNALCPHPESFLGLRLPPVPQVSILVILTAKIVKAMCYFMPNDTAHTPKVECLGELKIEEASLE